MHIKINRINYLVFVLVLILILVGCDNSNNNPKETNETSGEAAESTTTATEEPSFSATPTPFITPTPSVLPTTTPDRKDYSVLKKQLEDYTAQFDGKYGIYFINLVSGERFGINATDEYIAASTSKLPMNLLLFKKIASGEIDPEMMLEYKEEDLEWGTGIIIKEEYGTKYSVLETARLSIVYSDNCGINMIIRLLGIDNIRAYMQELGGEIYYGTRHRSCPKDMALYAEELYRFYLEEPDTAGILINNLENTIFNDRINLLLPETVRVAHKIGNFTRTANDVGIVFATEPYVISLMSDDVDFAEGCSVLAEISKKVYDFMEKNNDMK